MNYASKQPAELRLSNIFRKQTLVSNPFFIIKFCNTDIAADEKFSFAGGNQFKIMSLFIVNIVYFTKIKKNDNDVL